MTTLASPCSIPTEHGNTSRARSTLSATQLDALQVLRPETHAEEFNEVHPGAAPNFEQSDPRYILPADLHKEIGNGTLALLRGP